MNSTFKRLIKKDPEIQSIDRFGITRIEGGWWIRLGFTNKKPQFMDYAWDSEFNGNAVKSLQKAVAIVRSNRAFYQREKYQPETNQIKGLTLTRTKNRSGKSHYWTWGFTYSENGRQRNRKFGFWNSGNIYEMYLKAIGFAISVGIQVEVNLIDEFFFQYIEKLDGEFLERSDIKVLQSGRDKLILKQRYIGHSRLSA